MKHACSEQGRIIYKNKYVKRKNSWDCNKVENQGVKSFWKKTIKTDLT